MDPAKLLAGVVTGAAGIVIGWSATALTLTGRVSAIEAALVRIESRLDNHQPPKEKP